MNDGPEWFSAKRFGYGAGMPRSWQGWLVTAIYLAIVLGAGLGFPDKPVIGLSIVVPATALFLLVAWRTTKGGWRWRWGDPD
jgi:hypothetical protein